MNKGFMRGLTYFTVIMVFVMAITSKTNAGFSPSEPNGPTQMSRTSDLRTIQKVLESKLIREKLGELGFATEEIQGRLDRLSDDQIHETALRVDSLKVGGDAVLGIGLGILILLALVLVVSAIAYFSGME